MEKKNTLNILRDFAIKIRFQKILENLKFNKANTEINKNLEIYIIKELQKVYTKLNTIGVYKVENKNDIKFLYRDSKNIQNLLLNCKKMIVFTVSIGDNIDKQIENFLKNEEILKAAIWDAIGSEAVEQSVNYLNDFFKKKFLLEDLITTTRFSAGYGDWDIKANFLISDLLELKKFDIKIDNYGLFRPQKTITAILGLKARNDLYKISNFI